MRQRSRTSAGAIYLNKEARLNTIKEAAIRARRRMPSIQRVILFGSLATGTPTPHSDADLLVIVNESVHHDARDRIPAALEALSPVPGPVDLFVLTAHEFEAARSSRAPLIREAVANGIDLL